MTKNFGGIMLNQKYSNVKKQIILTLIIALAITIFSCDSKQISGVPKSASTEKETLVETVNQFLELTKNKKTNEAMELFLKEKSPQTNYVETEKTSDFDWATFLLNRSLFSQGIKDANLNGDEGVVIVKLGETNTSILEGKFSLKKVDEKWKIYKLDFGNY